MNIPSDLARRVLDAIGDAVTVVDLEGRIVGWAGSARELYGREADEVLGQRIATEFPELLRMDERELTTLGGAERLDTVIRLGEHRQLVAATATPVRDERGRLLGVATLARPMRDWLDPAERAGRPRREWHRQLGTLVREVIEQAGRNPGSMDVSEDVARILVAQAHELVPGTECLLCVVPRERQDVLRVLAGSGRLGELVGRQWRTTGLLLGKVLAEGRAIETACLQELSGQPQLAAASGMVAGRMVPLPSIRPLPDGRRVLGVLAFLRPTRAYFTPYERRLVDEFAHLVSLSLQRSELLRSAQEAADRLKTGVNVAEELARSLDPAEVMTRLVRLAAQAASAERVTLLEVEGDEAEVVGAYDESGRPTPKGQRFPVRALVSGGEPVVERALQDRRPRICGAYRVPGHLPLDWGQVGPRHTLVLPLALNGTATGALLVTRMRDQPFRRDDAATLQLVGNVAALMIRNARLVANAQEASRARSDFLNMAGHELRTPLTVIKGYLSMLGDGSLGEPPPELHQRIELLINKADELGTLIDDLLFTSRLESGRLPAHAMRLDLLVAVREAARRAEPRVQLMGGELQVEVTWRPLTVKADPEHVARILDNLINNALTYRRPDQRAWVRIRAGVEDGMAVVSVEDRGRGVPPEMRERIFERFVRGDEAFGGASGTGLGLYICRQLAGRHGGRLELDWSVPGEGSCFSLRLPLVTS
jgi:PAS domain S-box-containing protein